MSVDAQVWVTPDVTLDKIRVVVAAALGAKAVLKPLTRSAGVRAAVEPTSTAPAELYRIAPIPTISPYYGSFGPHSYHIASRWPHGVFTCLSARSCAGPIAVFRRVAETFGGIVQTNDAAGERSWERYPKPILLAVNSGGLLPTDGEAWDRFEAHLAAVRHTAPEELEAASRVASYKDHGAWARAIPGKRPEPARVRSAGEPVAYLPVQTNYGWTLGIIRPGMLGYVLAIDAGHFDTFAAAYPEALARNAANGLSDEDLLRAVGRAMPCFNDRRAGDKE